MLRRLANAGFVGIVVGLIAAFLLYLVVDFTDFNVNYLFWGGVLGVLAGVVAFFNDERFSFFK